MIKPKLPLHEDKRLQSLCSLNILDTLDEERFDRFTRIAKKHFDVSIVLISLVDAERQWFKSRQGLDATETPRDISFCGHAILQNGIFNIPNALEDERFADNPLVTGPPNIRFYAGAPLHAPDGQAIGTLCIIDDKPREFSAEELVVLRDLANGVEEELSQFKSSIRIKQHNIYATSYFSFFMGGVVSLFLFFQASQIEVGQTNLKMQSMVDERSAALSTELETVEDVMQGIAGLYAASAHVNPQEFANFLIHGFPNKKDIHAIVWIENLDNSELENFYRLAAKDGYSNFRLRGLDANNQLINVAPLPNNNVVYHVYNRNQKHWFSNGLNLSTLPAYKTLLNNAKNSGKLVASLKQNNSAIYSDKEVELFLPVYHHKNNSGSGLQGKKELRGYIGLLLGVGDTVEAAYSRYVSKTGGLDVYIVNAEPKQNREILYFHASRARTSAVEPLPLEKVEQGRFVSHDFKFANIHWRAVLRPIPGRYESGKSTTPWLVLVSGLLFSLVVAGYLNTLRRRREDIAQQVQLRTDELNNSRERIRAVIDTVVDGIVTIDKNGLVQTFNPAAENIFGYSANEVIDHNVKMLMPTPYTKEHDGYLHNYLTTGEKKVIGIGREVVGLCKDGSTFPMELSVSEMEINGERMFTGIVRDITERKKVERMKNEFISTVSHELRTPLTSIRGALGLVLGKAADKLPDQMLNMLEMANRNSKRLTLLINDLLDLEKISSGSLEFEFKVIDLMALAQQAMADNEGYASQHQVNLLLETQLKEAFVLGDAHRLLQVFANLISNAVKFSPPNGSVEILIDSHEMGYRVVVRDHGTGIPEEFRSRIFQRFAQADSSDTREKGGTGLGLSISKAIIEHHNGSIDYETKQGHGTKFFFDLAFSADDSRESNTSEHGTHVLICEDNPDVAEILAEMLTEENLTSDIAASAEAARILLAKNTYSVMLLDLNLPDMDGLQFIKELRTEYSTVELPIIVVSGQATEGRASFNGDAVMVVDWIQKPVDKEQFERALKEALHQKQYPRVLHVEDDNDVIQIVESLLSGIADVSFAKTVSKGREFLRNEKFELVILDINLPDGSGLKLLQDLNDICPVIIFSAQILGSDVSKQVEAALTKTMTSNEQLLTTIKELLKGSAQ